MCEVAEASTTKEVVACVRERVLECARGLSKVFVVSGEAKSSKVRLAEAERLLEEAAEFAGLKRDINLLEEVAEKVEDRRATFKAFISRSDKRG